MGDFQFTLQQLHLACDTIYQKIKYESNIWDSHGVEMYWMDACMFALLYIADFSYKYLHNSKNRQPPGYLLLPVGRGKPTAQLSKHQNLNENLRRI